jgi:hypothetical protein
MKWWRGAWAARFLTTAATSIHCSTFCNNSATQGLASMANVVRALPVTAMVSVGRFFRVMVR